MRPSAEAKALALFGAIVKGIEEGASVAVVITPTAPANGDDAAPPKGPSKTKIVRTSEIPITELDQRRAERALKGNLGGRKTK